MTESSSLREQGLAAFRFAGKFLATLALFIAALWLIGACFRASKWAGLFAVVTVFVSLYLTAHRWVRWLPGLLVFGVLNSIFGLATHRAPTNSQTVLSTGFSALWLIFYLVGYLVSYYYDAEFLNPLDRCAFLVYLSSVGLSAFLSRDNAGVVTPSLLWSAAVGMAAIAVAFIVQRSRLKGKGQAA